MGTGTVLFREKAQYLSPCFSITAFKQLDRIPDMQRGEGCVVCMANDVFPITPDVKAVGVCYL